MTTDPITGVPIAPRGLLPAGAIPAFVPLAELRRVEAERDAARQRERQIRRLVVCALRLDGPALSRAELLAVLGRVREVVDG